MKTYTKKAPFAEIWSEKRCVDLKSRGIGFINMGSRLKARNPVSEEIDRILSERSKPDEKKHS